MHEWRIKILNDMLHFVVLFFLYIPLDIHLPGLMKNFVKAFMKGEAFC